MTNAKVKVLCECYSNQHRLGAFLYYYDDKLMYYRHIYKDMVVEKRLIDHYI